MKKYIRSRIIMFIEMILILSVTLILNKETFNQTSFSVVTNTEVNKSISKKVIQESQNSLFKDKIKENEGLYAFMGELTGYSGDCPLCSGYLACPPSRNVLKTGIYYDDKKYGKIRIVASSKNYPCGTILKFNVKKISKDPIIAIVLDRGVSGNVIDLLTENQQEARKNVGRVKNLEFEVLREGWNNE